MTKNELVKLADETMRLGKTLLENARIKQEKKIVGGETAWEDYERKCARSLFHEISPPQSYFVYSWERIDANLKTIQTEATQKYQQFYSSACQFIEEHLPERKAEFVEYFRKHTEQVMKELDNDETEGSNAA